jgi:curved DNA-binding protein CbpA
MIDLDSLSPYEILDVDPRATVAEIKRALQIAVKTYGLGHMATYGLFTDEQREEILNRVHEAYTILTDPERRKQCDEKLRGRGDFPAEETAEPSKSEMAALPSSSRPRVWELPRVEEPEIREEKERRIREVLTSAEERREWTGDLLRQVREIRGFTLEEIATKTKIGRGHLRSIEDDSLEYLPPDVYVKGFVTQIAKVLGLDCERIAPRVMEHIRRRRGTR